mgnify:CR=1 FL=1
MLKYAIVFCGLLLWALPAEAGWNNCGTPSATTAMGDILTPKTRSRFACFDTAVASSGTSTLLDVSNCSHFDVWFDPDLTGTAHVSVAQLYRCALKSIAAEWCSKMLVDTNADGTPNDTTMDGYTVGRQGQQGQTAMWIYVDVTAPGAGDVARTMVTCY